MPGETMVVNEAMVNDGAAGVKAAGAVTAGASRLAWRVAHEHDGERGQDERGQYLWTSMPFHDDSHDSFHTLGRLRGRRDSASGAAPRRVGRRERGAQHRAVSIRAFLCLVGRFATSEDDVRNTNALSRRRTHLARRVPLRVMEQHTLDSS